jgi:hypothetical protein
MSDLEGKAAREAATERGREGVSIMKQAVFAPTPATLPRSGCGQVVRSRSSYSH